MKTGPRRWLLLAVVAVAGSLAAWMAANRWGWFADPQAPPETDLSLAHPLLIKTIEADREAVAAEPKSAEAWGRLGMRYMAHHYVEPAIDCFAAAGARDPEDSRWSYYRAVLLEETDLRAALSLHDDSVAKNPSYLPGRLRRASALLRADRIDEAEREMRAVSEEASGDDPAIQLAAAIGLGRAAQAGGDWKEARMAFAEAAKGAPWSRVAQLEVARACARLGDWEGARAARIEADRLPPGPTDPPDEALAAVEEMEVVSRRLGMQADELVQKRDYAGAAAVLEKMVAERPELARPRMNLAQVYLAQGRMREAVTAYSEVVRDFPRDAMARYQLGLALELVNDPWGALERYRQCVAEKPDYAEAHFMMGRLLEKMNRRPEAIEAYRQATAAAPGFAPAHLALGEALHKQGDARGAVEPLRRAVQLSPGDATAQQYLDRVLKEIPP